MHWSSWVIFLSSFCLGLNNPWILEYRLLSVSYVVATATVCNCGIDVYFGQLWFWVEGSHAPGVSRDYHGGVVIVEVNVLVCTCVLRVFGLFLVCARVWFAIGRFANLKFRLPIQMLQAFACSKFGCSVVRLARHYFAAKMTIVCVCLCISWEHICKLERWYV